MIFRLAQFLKSQQHTWEGFVTLKSEYLICWANSRMVGEKKVEIEVALLELNELLLQSLAEQVGINYSKEYLEKWCQ